MSTNRRRGVAWPRQSTTDAGMMAFPAHWTGQLSMARLRRTGGELVSTGVAKQRGACRGACPR